MNKEAKQYSKKANYTSNNYKLKKENGEIVKHIDENKDHYVFCVTGSQGNEEIECKIGGIVVNGVVDSGSRYNLMDMNTWND